MLFSPVPQGAYDAKATTGPRAPDSQPIQGEQRRVCRGADHGAPSSGRPTQPAPHCPGQAAIALRQVHRAAGSTRRAGRAATRPPPPWRWHAPTRRETRSDGPSWWCSRTAEVRPAPPSPQSPTLPESTAPKGDGRPAAKRAACGRRRLARSEPTSGRYRQAWRERGGGYECLEPISKNCASVRRTS